MSSCIASQLPHAVGLAWAARIQGDDVVVLGCLGDGATSEEDFHVAANFAGVYGVPVVFFCQNNQWAISTPVALQTAAPTIAAKAVAYGFGGVRCDGNDVLAVYGCVREAVDRARRGGGPTLVEALTYRVSAHSSSDDPSRYRDEKVTERWRTRDPLARYGAWLRAQGLLDAAGEERMRAEIDSEVRDAVAKEEPVGAPPLATLVEDVFAEVPQHLRDQLAEITPLPRQKLGGVHQ
jgi:pyruvate dehydrogenase E1 component alpha subunit/2-oxoisovalerate dehydrogenase E1 component alpha subunit